MDKLPKELNPANSCTCENNNKIAFFTCNSKLSNHYHCEFTVDGKNFTSVEQYFMYCKASIFGDVSACKPIMSSTDSVQAKTIGNRI